MNTTAAQAEPDADVLGQVGANPLTTFTKHGFFNVAMTIPGGLPLQVYTSLGLEGPVNGDTLTVTIEAGGGIEAIQNARDLVTEANGGNHVDGLDVSGVSRVGTAYTLSPNA